MTTAIALRRLPSRCLTTPAFQHLLSTRSASTLSHSHLPLISRLSHPILPLSSRHTRALATAAAPITSHSIPPPPQPPTPTTPPPPHLSPSQLRAASAARAQQAVLDAKEFEVKRAQTLRNKNVALALACIGFVVWCYWFSVYSVRKSADSLTGGEVEEINRELEEEEALLRAERK